MAKWGLQSTLSYIIEIEEANFWVIYRVYSVNVTIVNHAINRTVLALLTLRSIQMGY